MALILMLDRRAACRARCGRAKGRFGRIGIAMLVYFIYSQLLAAGRTWIEGGRAGMVGYVVGARCVALARALWLLLREAPLQQGRGPWRCRHDVHPFQLCHQRTILGNTALVMAVLLVLSGAVSVHHRAERHRRRHLHDRERCHGSSA